MANDQDIKNHFVALRELVLTSMKTEGAPKGVRLGAKSAMALLEIAFLDLHRLADSLTRIAKEEDD